MKYEFKRVRSDFWIVVYDDEDQNSYNILTKHKYVNIIDCFFPMLEHSSPTKWRISSKYSDMSNLWLPAGCHDSDTMTRFLAWCKAVTSEVLWLGANKNIEEYFSDELDYCIASDFNFVHGNGRTEIGEAEYQLKYNMENLDIKERDRYAILIIKTMLNNCKYVPLRDGASWYVSPIPVTEAGKTKIAWQMAEEIARQLRLPFVDPVLCCDKPLMKDFSIKERIKIWASIYHDHGVRFDKEIRGKNIIVIDDLYQSGTTMWEYASYLKKSGAGTVFGIVCVKSLKDSDNT